MEATTLMTFRPRLPPSIRTVDLLGSWDNFQEAYPLQKDRQAGPGQWRGCHSFKNIVCDGRYVDTLGSRNGGLKMGGTYWYFYRLDGDLEQHDLSEPSTTACPLLPGQQVNVLDVPSQLQHEDERDDKSPTLIASAAFTLDPKAKYISPKPSMHRDITQMSDHSPQGASTRPVPADVDHPVHYPLQRSAASTAPFQPFGRGRPVTSQGPCIVLPKVSSWMAIFRRMRGTRSAPGGNVPQTSKRPRSSRSVWETGPESSQADRNTFSNLSHSRVRTLLNPPAWPLADASTEQVPPWTADSFIDHFDAGHAPLEIMDCQSYHQHTPTANRLRFSEESLDISGDSHVLGAPQSSRRSHSSSGRAHVHRASDLAKSTATEPNNTVVSDVARVEHIEGQANPDGPKIEEECFNAVRRVPSPLVLPIQSNAPALKTLPYEEKTTAQDTGLRQSARPPSMLYDGRKTVETFYAATSSCDGQLSPHYLSQPESPSVRDFEEAWESESQAPSETQASSFASPPLLGDKSTVPECDLLQMPQLPNPGFHGYGLPGQDHGSTLTLRKPASATFTLAETFPKTDRLVQSWDDGSSHRHVTALDELVDDLGYLGNMIV
ncbi:MAG: hypothetical protein LQ338_002166 [Usnochroma carphineum]|nr:MAG: hypothetical protein LQ338_002166 [Usnochroma carphineum]